MQVPDDHIKRTQYLAKKDMPAVIRRCPGQRGKPRAIVIAKDDAWIRYGDAMYLYNEAYPGWRLAMPAEDLSPYFRKVRRPAVPSVTERINPETGRPYLSHPQLVTLGHHILRRMGYPYILCEPGFRDELPDAFGMSENMTCLIECKATRSDFLADRKKEFRIHPEKGIGRQRIYLVNKGICTPDELPDGWQLIEAIDDHTVVTEFGDLSKHWLDRYMFEKRNIGEEYRLMCSWAYRKEHGCLKFQEPARIRVMKRS